MFLLEPNQHFEMNYFWMIMWYEYILKYIKKIFLIVTIFHNITVYTVFLSKKNNKSNFKTKETLGFDKRLWMLPFLE